MPGVHCPFAEVPHLLRDIAADVENLNTVRCCTPEHEAIGVAAAARESPHGPLLSRAGASADRAAPNTRVTRVVPSRTSSKASMRWAVTGSCLCRSASLSATA